MINTVSLVIVWLLGSFISCFILWVLLSTSYLCLFAHISPASPLFTVLWLCLLHLSLPVFPALQWFVLF